MPSVQGGKPSEMDIRNRFFHHPPTDKTRPKHEEVSQLCYDLAVRLSELVPPGRNHSLMLTALEEVRMRGNMGIACDTPEEDR